MKVECGPLCSQCNEPTIWFGHVAICAPCAHKNYGELKEEVERLICALEQVMLKDGWGADGSPPGPCYKIAKSAIIKS